MKLSKEAKARIKRMSAAERKILHKAALCLADCEIITRGRYDAIARTLKSCGHY